MKRLTHLPTPLALLLAAVMSSAAYAQEDWSALSQQAVALYQQGDQDQALVLARKALGLAEAGKAPLDIATSLNNLAYMYRNR
ncbi:MAG TPA: hypothetical protein PKY03_07650, partial [Moraxellaceae bacterium]|nr:hypothetical protein [Moraxellaceae bacterium]